MRVFITVKAFGGKRDLLSEKETALPDDIGTVGELLNALVALEVAKYNDRADDTPERGEGPLTLALPLPRAAIDAGAEAGKVTFGRRCGKKTDAKTALDAAVSAYNDGLFRIFIGDAEAGTLDDPLTLREGDRLTFIKLIALSGF